MKKIYLKIFFLVLPLIFFNNSKAKIVDTIEALEEKSIGDQSAPIKIVEFASMTCGHCAKFHNEVFPSIKENFIDNGKVFLLTKTFHLINMR